MENVEWLALMDTVASFVSLFSTLVLTFVIIKQQEIIAELLIQRFKDDTK